MISVKETESGNVELTVLLPVVEKEYGNYYKGAGFTPKDLGSYGFHVVMAKADWLDFVSDVVAAHVGFTTETLEKNQKEVDGQAVGG